MFKKGIFLVLCLMVFAGSSWAKLMINPSLGVKAVTDSNIYLAPSGEKSSLITIYTPELKLMLPVSEQKFGLNAKLDSINYAELPDINNANNLYMNYFINLKVPSNAVKFNISYNYFDTTDPTTSEQIKRLKRKQYDSNCDITIMVSSKLSFEISNVSIRHNYEEEIYKPLFNRLESIYGMILYFGFSPKTSMLFEYDTGSIVYDDAINNNSSKITNLKLGVKGQLTGKTVGVIKVGSQSKKFDRPVNKDASPTLYTLSTLTKFSDMTQLILTGEGGAVESVYIDNPYYEIMGFKAGIIQKIASKWTTNVTLGYEADKYPVLATGDTQKREDTNTTYGIGLKYQIIKWLSAEVTYSSGNRDSNINPLDFKDTLTGLNLKAEF